MAHEIGHVAADNALIYRPKPLIFAENVIYCGQIDENTPPSIALPVGSLFFRAVPLRGRGGSTEHSSGR